MSEVVKHPTQRSHHPMISRLLRRWDNEENELVLRWRLWKSRWFPHRTAEMNVEESVERGELVLGPWKWHRPERFERRQP